MPIEIKRLTPALAADYLHFFDTTPHSTNRAEHRCYCVCWCGEDSAGRDFSSAEKRRALAKEYIENNRIQGYLAYRDGAVVGWCNANAKSDCYACLSWRMFMGGVCREAEKVKSVFCFAVAPECRGQGIAAGLLARVCADAKDEGYAAVESYPNRAFISTESDFMGPVALYEKQGFAVQYETDGRVVMRKQF